MNIELIRLTPEYKEQLLEMLPVVVYPQKYLDELRGELNEVKERIASGEQPVFDSVEALFEKLEN